MTIKPLALVTGGAGFIGSHMVDCLLARGYSVRVVDNLVGGRESNLAHHANNVDLNFEQDDIRKIKPSSPLFKDVNIVLHFAGIGDIVPSITHPIDYMSVNIQGTVSVLEAARAACVEKLVYAASSSCYGIASTPTAEDHSISPQYPYALSKYQGEMAALHWHRVYGLPVNSVRIFNAYGIRGRTSGAYGAVFGVFLKQKIENQPFTVVGDGSQARDFLYATDVATAFLAAAETPLNGEIWNLGAGSPQTINRLVELLGGEKVFIPIRPGEPHITWADTAKIRQELNWSPLVSFADGISLMMAEIESWKDAPLWTPDSIAKATETWFNYVGKSNSAC